LLSKKFEGEWLLKQDSFVDALIGPPQCLMAKAFKMVPITRRKRRVSLEFLSAFNNQPCRVPTLDTASQNLTPKFNFRWGFMKYAICRVWFKLPKEHMISTSGFNFVQNPLNLMHAHPEDWIQYQFACLTLIAAIFWWPGNPDDSSRMIRRCWKQRSLRLIGW